MEKIKILGIEEKPTQTGKMRWIVRTSRGDVNCWSVDIANGLKKLTSGEMVEAEISEKDGYYNLKKVLPCNQNEVVTNEHIPAKGTVTITQGFKPIDTTSMYVSYAKDIFVALLPESRDKPLSNKALMDEAIDLIKHAKGLFENG